MTASSAFVPLVPPRLGAASVDLRDEAEKARTRGYAAGFAEGLAEAVEEGRRQRAAAEEAAQARALLADRAVAAEIAALRAARAALDERVADLSGQDAARIEELALSLAAAILNAELSAPARSAAHAMRRALEEAPVQTWVRVTFHAADAAVLAADQHAAALLQQVEVVASEAVDAGGALVELEDGAVDARIGAALTRATAALRGDAEEGIA